MRLSYRGLHVSLLAGAALCAAQQASAGSFTVPGATGPQTVGAGDTGTIGAGSTLSASTPITWSLTNNSTQPATINNSGTINATGSSNGVAASGTPAGAQNFVFNNLTSSSKLLVGSGDAFGVGKTISIGGGAITINNSGTVSSTGGRGVNYNAANLNTLGSFSLNNNSGATFQSLGDTVRITAQNLQTNSTYNVSVDNAGKILSTGVGSNNGQALDFDDLVSSKGTVTIKNESTGIIQAADADAIRPGNNSTVNNYGQIISLNGTSTSTGNDGIDFGTNNGSVNNFSTGSIIGARDGITGKTTPTVVNDGIITGQAGSGINIDSTAGTMSITNNAKGIITGTVPSGSAADGDGIDADYLVNINNSGQILAIGTPTHPDPSVPGEINEALAIGGGTVTNNAGGLIQSDQRAITVNDSNLGNAFGAVNIDNSGTITGKDGEAINIKSIKSNTLTNRAGGVINGSVVTGDGDDTVNLYTGSTLNGALNTGAGNDTIHLMAGTGKGALSNVSNAETLKVDGGSWTLTGTQSYAVGATVANGATLAINDTTASFGGTLQINGALTSDPATIEALNLSVSANGYIQASAGDLYQVSGNFTNESTQNTLWNTAGATLEFIGADGASHSFELAGTDFGRHANVTNDFGWGGLMIDSGNTVQLDGLGSNPHALYVTDLLGADISGHSITNILGGDGLNIYYDGRDADNAYLKGMTYFLTGGGRLISDVPEPETWSLFIIGFGVLGASLRRRRMAAAGA